MIRVNLMTKSLRRTLTHRRASQRYRERHPERIAKTYVKYRSSDKYRAVTQRNYAARKESGRARASSLKYLYGITPDKYEEMFKKQNGVCAICENPPKEGKRLGVDHCHDSGDVRGLLCDDCNTGLGKFRDDPDLLNAAREYLWNIH